MKKNICFYSGDITNTGGTERVAILIANELRKNSNYKIHFLSLVEKKNTPFFFIDDSIQRDTVYDKPVKGMTHILGIINRTRKYLKKRRIDILIDIDGILDMYTLPCKLFLKVKIISWEHYNFYQNPIVPYRKWTRRMAARWADAIVTLTEEDKNYYCSHLKIKHRIECIYNPIICKENVGNYDEKSKILLSIGRLTYQKGFDLLVLIAEKFLKKYPDWKWIILGEGEDRPMLEKMIADAGLDRQIEMPGNVHNVDDYYKKSALFVMTSRFEGLPMTLLETKPYSLPIISFNCKTGPSELIDDGINGFLISEGKLDTMAKKIEKLINDKQLRKSFSSKCLNGVERFEYKNIVLKWERLLNNI